LPPPAGGRQGRPYGRLSPLQIAGNELWVSPDSDRTEMPQVERGNGIGAKALCDRDYHSVHKAELESSVALTEFSRFY